MKTMFLGTKIQVFKHQSQSRDFENASFSFTRRRKNSIVLKFGEDGLERRNKSPFSKNKNNYLDTGTHGLILRRNDTLQMTQTQN